MAGSSPFILSFFFNDTATTEIYTLSLHDALPIYEPPQLLQRSVGLVDQVLDGLDRLAEVVRRDVGRHPDRDPRGAVDDEVGKPGRQDRRLLQPVVEVGDEIDGVLVDVLKHRHRDAGEAGPRGAGPRRPGPLARAAG